jgi:hypothetical protein
MWWLSRSGERIDDAVAKIVIANPAIVSVGDALFADIPSQTWRYAE